MHLCSAKRAAGTCIKSSGVVLRIIVGVRWGEEAKCIHLLVSAFLLYSARLMWLVMGILNH